MLFPIGLTRITKLDSSLGNTKLKLAIWLFKLDRTIPLWQCKEIRAGDYVYTFGFFLLSVLAAFVFAFSLVSSKPLL
jgi:hypothetical protein